MEITSESIKNLREKTGAGIMDCKTALKEANGDFEAAVTILKNKGISTAAKKADREAKEGLIGSYIHSNGKIGVLVEVNCETDFVARTDVFKEMVKNLSMHIAATNPKFLSREIIPAETIDKQKAEFLAEAKATGKPDTIAEKIVEGKMEKYYTENCLMEQSYVKNPDITIKDYVTETIAKVGENISIGRYVRLQMGETAEE